MDTKFDNSQTVGPSGQSNQIRPQDATPEQAADFVLQALHKANKAGVFNLDESYALKVLYDIILKGLTKK
jgi:hypothetical protein